MSDVSDDELLQRARNHDTGAFEELVARNRDRVFGIALRIVHSEAEAAEVTQETFLAAWRSLTQLTGASFSHWVHRIAANRALMRLRHQKVAKAVEESKSGKVDRVLVLPPVATSKEIQEQFRGPGGPIGPIETPPPPAKPMEKE